jgi:hypothetical protein
VLQLGPPDITVAMSPSVSSVDAPPDNPLLLPHTAVCPPQLLAELALSLRDDLRPYVPDLLPRFVALLVEAERTCCYDMVRPALAALEVRGRRWYCVLGGGGAGGGLCLGAEWMLVARGGGACTQAKSVHLRGGRSMHTQVCHGEGKEVSSGIYCRHATLWTTGHIAYCSTLCRTLTFPQPAQP